MNVETDAGRDFEPVALAFVEELGRREGDTLARYLARYPHYAYELTLLAVETAAHDPRDVPALAPPAALFAKLRDDARAALQAPQEAGAIASLLGQARTHAGLTPRALAAKLGVGVDVLALLEERHIAPETIVAAFIARIAASLGASADAVRAYLAGPPLTSTAGVAYHAPHGHTPPRRLTFRDAIAESNLTTHEQKAQWLGEDSRRAKGEGRREQSDGRS